jgi:hypothetical protein
LHAERVAIVWHITWRYSGQRNYRDESFRFRDGDASSQGTSRETTGRMARGRWGIPPSGRASVMTGRHEGHRSGK